MANTKRLGVASFVEGQKKQLLKLLSGDDGDGIRHIILCRVIDDTNVTTATDVKKKAVYSGNDLNDSDIGLQEQGPNAAQTQPLGPVNMSFPSTNVGILGRRKVSALLGLLQRLSVRRRGTDPAGLPEVATIHVPAQVLPKAQPCMLVCVFLH